MGIGDLFKASENKKLKQRASELESMLTPEMRDLDAVNRNLESKKKQVADTEKQISLLNEQKKSIERDILTAKKQLIETNDAILMQEFGLYEPKYDFVNSDEYKAKLTDIRSKQKDMVRNKTAATGANNWTVNGDAKKGQKMVADMQKLLVRAFNSECDEVVAKVKFNNIEASEKRISSSRDAISKLGQIMSVAISPRYYKLKLEELYLAHEYQIKKQEEKDALRQAREEQREQAKLQKEIEEARKKIEKDRQHHEKARKQALERLAVETDEAKKAALEAKLIQLNEQLEKLDEDMKAVDYREANQKAGYVYIISNIGAFGEGVYKIGMTRRLEPMDRIDELGDASVPFAFDVHALIFTEDAPKLENALHHAFENKKVNMVNTRREFFRVSLDEIKQVVKENLDNTVEFVYIPDASQDRESLLISQKL